MDTKSILKSKMNIEELGDYSYELLEEISRLVSELPESKFISSNKFIDIKNRLDKAKSLGINVGNYEEQIHNFRRGLLKRIISEKITLIQTASKNNTLDQGIYDISSVESNYNEFQSDYTEDHELDGDFQSLLNIITQVKIGAMIEEYILDPSSSGYDFDKITTEMLAAEEKGIDTTKLRMQILGD